MVIKILVLGILGERYNKCYVYVRDVMIKLSIKLGCMENWFRKFLVEKYYLVLYIWSYNKDEKVSWCLW